MRPYYNYLFLLLLFPALAHAQSLQNFFINVTRLLDTVIVPFLLSLAFLFFIFNLVRYFIIGSTSEDGRKKAKALAIYGVSAFVLIVIFWGIVNLLITSIGLEDCRAVQSDYANRNFVGPPPPNCI